MVSVKIGRIFVASTQKAKRRFLTKRAAIRWYAKQRYKEKYDLYRCWCSHENGRCDYCHDEDHRNDVVKRYSKWLMRHAELTP